MPPAEEWTSAETKANENDLNTAPYETTVITFDAKGQKHEIQAKGPGKRIVFCSYHQVVGYGHGESQELNKPGNPVQYADPGYESMLVRVAGAWPIPRPAECCLVPEYFNELQENVEEWKKSEAYVDLTAHVQRRAHKMTEVKNVNLLQYYAAMHICDMFAKEQKKPKNEIPIYVQDPEYCAECKRRLVEELDFKVLGSNAGYLYVDGNTFVVSSSPGAPVRQIIGDLTLDTKGPAGMLCNIVQGDGHGDAFNMIDADSEPLYLWFYMSTQDGMQKEWSRNPNPNDFDEGESDWKQEVRFGNVTNMFRSVFDEIGLYCKPKNLV
ncbi:hypothetical protein EK21DRAFT_119465 [Setomelanomma holmii]|uniref:Uncharacterized protein n=1 Tax=Setomelanomma holmii TaxID=210430 RepID=A0A9P4LFL3_9PLEO|nr:hypothetical protein EK21DRAFT_119465 [Setomelanomma holmii]